MRKNNLIPKRLKEEIKYMNIPIYVIFILAIILMFGFQVLPYFFPFATSMALTILNLLFAIYLMLPYKKRHNWEIVLDYVFFLIRKKVYKC